MVTDARRACHWTLLRLAGRVPDGLLTGARRLLAHGRYAAMARLVTPAVAGRGIRLHPDDLRCLEGLLGGPVSGAPVSGAPVSGAPVSGAPVSGAPVSGAAVSGAAALGGPVLGDPMPRHRFFPGRPLPGTRRDDIERAAVAAVRAEPDACGLWRSSRVPADGRQVAKSVFVVETDADAPGLAGRLQDRLIAAGELYPQVEAYEVGEWLPAYQRTARGAGELLWSRTPDPGVRIAPLIDGFVGIDSGRCEEAEQVESEAERGRILGYLDAGPPVLITTARLYDVVDRGLGRIVPMNFRTDGAWIWSDISAYYLRAHGMLPDRALVAHIESNGYRMPRVDGVAEFRAISVLYRPEEEDVTARR